MPLTVNTIVVSCILAFLSTTIDDFAIMLIFFGKVKMEHRSSRLGYLKVIVGQTIGFTIIVLISLLGLLLGFLAPTDYINLVGFVPLLIGIYKSFELCLCPPTSELKHLHSPTDRKYSEYSTLSQIEDGEISRISPLPSDNESTTFTDSEDDHLKMLDSDKETSWNLLNTLCCSDSSHLMDPLIYEVLGFSLICGRYNIAIYTSLFASVTTDDVLFIILIFYILLAFSVTVAFSLMNIPGVATTFEKYSKYFVPLLLVLLGGFILSESVISPWDPLKSSSTPSSASVSSYSSNSSSYLNSTLDSLSPSL